MNVTSKIQIYLRHIFAGTAMDRTTYVKLDLQPVSLAFTHAAGPRRPTPITLTSTSTARAVPLTLAGWTSSKIAEAFGVREDTVRLWRSDFTSPPAVSQR
jgi:hypothetical protein